VDGDKVPEPSSLVLHSGVGEWGGGAGTRRLTAVANKDTETFRRSRQRYGNSNRTSAGYRYALSATGTLIGFGYLIRG